MNSIVQKLGAVEGTIYQPNDTPILLSDHFSLSDDYSRYHDFPFVDNIQHRAVELMAQNNAYQQLSKKMAALQIQEEEIIRTTEEHAFERQEIRRELRQAKKELNAAAAAITEEATQELSGAAVLKKFITYKNYLALNNFANISEYQPQLKKFAGDWLWEKPVFTSNIGNIRSVTSLAVCGGPCLYGSDEINVSYKTAAGGEQNVDYHRYFYWAEDTSAASKLWLDAVPGSINFTPRKQGITPQDFEIFDGLFQLAVLLDVPLLIMLPDDAYLKFFDSMIAPLDAEQRGILHQKYKEALNITCDVYLQFIEKFYAHYKPKQFEIFHRRNKSLTETFYQKRELFCQKTRQVTSNKYKEASIMDYITMPALPYYLWDTTAILNLDSLEESDPMRKCMNCHKGSVQNFPIMMTEKISRDGKTSYYENTLEWKDYITIDQLSFVN